ncbi:hypothetical protein N9A45_00125 [bacterium]|nr:hypothetical protein [bacterium]
MEFTGASSSAWSVKYNGGSQENDPTIEVCSVHSLKITKTFINNYHPLKIVEGDETWSEAGQKSAITGGFTSLTGQGEVTLGPNADKTYTYICTSHSGMIGKIKFGASYCTSPTAAKCDTHTCPSGHVLRANPKTILCAGTTCASPTDDDTCCEPGYSFGLADINLCPDDSAVNIVWAGEHNIQESNGYDCATNLKSGSGPLSFDGSHTHTSGDEQFLSAGTRKNITANLLSDWNSTRYFRCSQHCSGARLNVTCNRAKPLGYCAADYAALGRVYDPAVPECPHGASPIHVNDTLVSELNNHTWMCRCGKCGEIFESMVQIREACVDGELTAVPGCNGVSPQTASSCDDCADGLYYIPNHNICTGCTEKGAIITADVAATLNPRVELCPSTPEVSAASCDTFTCPSGWVDKANKASLTCAGATCVQRGTSSGEYGYGTEGWGQGEPMLDLHRCCDYDNNDFAYVEHAKNIDETWKTVAQGGSGCLSDKCYEKSHSSALGYNVCNWGSGTCAECDYCKEYEANLPSKDKFVDGDSCSASCRGYLYESEDHASRQQFCTWSNCKKCDYCEETYLDKFANANCDAKCSKYWELKVRGTPKYEHFCLWSSCRDCTLCSEERSLREASQYNASTPNCDAKCSKYWELQRVSRTTYYDKYDSHCLWSSCRGCQQCQTEKTARESTTFAVAADTGDGLSCDAKCSKYWEMKSFGYERYRDFCFWGSCKKCSQCQTEKTERETTSFAVVTETNEGSCLSSCKDYYELREKGTYDNFYADFCLWGSCNKCSQCQAEKTERDNFQYSEKSGCHADCKDYATLKIKNYNNGEYEDFCTLPNCQDCAQCKKEDLQREKRDFKVREDGANGKCLHICQHYAKLKLQNVNDGEYNAFCLWESCTGCRKCVEEKAIRGTEKYKVGAKCSTNCQNYAELKTKNFNNGEYNGFCVFSECEECEQCVAEEKWRNQKSFRTLGADGDGKSCASNCKGLRKDVLNNVANAADFCDRDSCARCPGCQGDREPRGRRLTSFRNNPSKLMEEPSFADVQRDLALMHDNVPSRREVEFALQHLSDSDPALNGDDTLDKADKSEPTDEEFQKDFKSFKHESPTDEEFQKDLKSFKHE